MRAQGTQQKTSPVSQPAKDLAIEMTRLAKRVHQFCGASRLTAVERESLKVVELTLLQAAQLTKSIQAESAKGSSSLLRLTRPRIAKTKD